MRITSTLEKRPYLETGKLLASKIKYFISYEGTKTEPLYFEGIKEYADSLGISASVEILPLNRSYHEAGYSNPFTGCLPRLRETLKEFQDRTMTLESLVTHTIDWAVEASLLKGKNNQAELQKIKKELTEKVTTSLNSERHRIQESELDEIGELACKYLGEIIDRTFREKQIREHKAHIHNQFQTFSANDKACLIIDRDKGSFTEAQYENTQTVCKAENIKLYISNPRFELWILLHFTDLNYLDLEKLKSDSGYLDECLNKYFPEYSKNAIHFDKLKSKIQTAIQNASKHCQDPHKLKTELGTSIGLLMAELITNKT